MKTDLPSCIFVLMLLSCMITRQILSTCYKIPVRTLFDCHPEGGVSALALSKDSKYLVTLGAGAAQRVCVWNLTDESESPECQVDLSPKYGCQERRHLEYSVPEITDQTFNMVQGSLSQSIFYYDVVQAFTATSAGNIVLWDKQTEYVSHQPVERKAIKLVPLQKEAITVLILTDSFIVTGNVNGQIKFYDGNLKLINVYNEFSLDPIRSISFSKEKASISGLGYPKDLHTGCQAICHKMTVIHKGLEQHEGQYMILIFWRTLSLNYDFVLSTTHATAVDVNAQRNVPQTLLKEHTEPLEAVACHPKQPLITMGSHSGTIKIWDYECKEAICSRVFRPHKQILCITYDPQDFVYLFMMVCFGPSYGSPVKKMAILPASKDDDPNSRYMAYITQDKVGIQILPLDGNPHNSFAMICHSTGVSTLACSYDCTVDMLLLLEDRTALSFHGSSVCQASAALGRKDMLPFYNLLEGGRDGQLFKNQDLDTMETRLVSTRIPLADVPFLMRVLGFYPTEQEKTKCVTDIDLEEFIKLYVNHRPASGISIQELCNAFQLLGKPDKGSRYSVDRDELLELLQARGEHMTEDDLAECFMTLLGISAEGGSCTESLLESALPSEISMETFATDILGVSAATQELPQEHGHHP